MAEPANLREPYNIDMARLRADVESASDGGGGIPGVQLVDPAAERIADMVAVAAAAAVAAQRVPKATVADIRDAARVALQEGS